MERNLGDPIPELKARKELHTLRQTTSVLDYASHFQRLLSFIPNLDPQHIAFSFWNGLKPKIQELLTGKIQEHSTWQEIRDLAHRFDTLVMEQRFPSSRRSYPVPRDHRPDDPMDLSAAYASRPTARGRPATPDPRRGRTPSPRRPTSDRPTLSKLTSAERDQLRSTGACFRCRQVGHFRSDCPLNRPSGKYSGSNARKN
jgi:hypothetical protein